MRLKIFFILLLFPLLSQAQKEITLTGTIGIESGETFSYQLIFTDSAGVLKGSSLTWLKKENDIKTSVIGKLDRKKKTISFKETEIVYNHGFESNATICLISATLKYAPERATNALFGPMSSSDMSNSYCGRGTVSFDNSDVLKQLFTEIKKDSVPTSRPKPKIIIVENNEPRQAAVLPQQDKVTSGIEKIYEWGTDTVILDIWDGGHIDGDMISLSFNDKQLLKRYTITKEKKQLNLLLSPGINIISITAENEGNEPPNTADVLLTDGEIKHSIVAYNSIGKKAIIKIRKK